jgi:sporulation protein YlmC with PRC-barrel domain
MWERPDVQEAQIFLRNPVSAQRFFPRFKQTLEEHMLYKSLATALLTGALMTGVASAQSTAANDTKMHERGEWRASKLAGVSVYNETNEKIGDVNDVILDKSGKATNVILGVGGFLGMGEHYVAVTFDQLKWVDEPVRSTTASTSTAPSGTATNVDNTRTTTGSATTTATTMTNENWYPDHAVLNANKGQLMSMPEFKY